jgi:tripartite-type tricarboxylate transporter receptor subunit TctC
MMNDFGWSRLASDRFAPSDRGVAHHDRGSAVSRLFRRLAAVCASTCACAIAVTAAGAAEFYEGKTIRFVVGLSAGGGYDTYARLIAQHIGRHVPGNPSVIVQNMPGAGSLTAVKHLDAIAPTDGTVIVVFNAGLITQSIVAPKKVDVDFRNYGWLGSASEDIRVCYVWHSRKAKGLKDLAGQKELTFGATTPGTLGYIEAQILNRYLGAPLRLVAGYRGSAEKRLAVESGELDGDCGGWVAIPTHWRTEAKVTAVVRFSRSLLPGMDASVPYVGDVVKDPLRLKALDLLLAAEDIGRPFIASKAVPADRMSVLRKAFEETLKDSALKADAERQQLTLSPMTGDQVQLRLGQLYASPKAVVAEARTTSGSK